MRSIDAVRAYRAGAGHRTYREQEADLFRQVNAALSHASDHDAAARARALADAERLWTTVIDLMRDPSNALPDAMRAAIVSVGMAVKREISQPDPDFAFVVQVNEQIAAGLQGQ